MEKCIPHNSLEMEKKTSSISYNAEKCFPYFQKGYVYSKM
jgi:hypothetical protein